MSGARAYLSIGDVLTLLREEFPDVTISKIRFLESQRLVNPERSPSGYRKFYEHDVERLRWVLREQRDNFLPLKVIRDRLARAGNGVPDDEPPPARPRPPGDQPGGGGHGDGSGGGTGPEAGRPAVAARVAAAVAATRLATESGGGNGTTVHVVAPAAGGEAVSGTRPAGGTSDAAAEPPGRTPAGASNGAGAGPGAGAATDPAAVAGEPGGAQPAGGGAMGGEAGGGGGDAVAEPDDETPVAPVTEGPRTGHGEREPDDETPETAEAEPVPAHASHEPPVAVPSHAPAHAVTLTGSAAAPDDRSPDDRAPAASLTLDELCATTGLAAAEVAALERFGLVEAITVAGATYYDTEAMMVATLAGELGRYGIEPRHLRVYRNAVDREVGLVEQVVAP
ncbi:MAG: MerR family transcriptional regulator, partial [Acidimicrobiales bacterium]